MKPRGQRDVFAGLIFAGFGATAAYVGRDYPMGSALRMGPGYFPMVLGWLLIGLGSWIGLRGLFRNGPTVEPPRWRPLLLVLSAITLFALTIDRFGLVVAVCALLLVGALASKETRPADIFAIVGGLLVLSLAVFVYGLGLPFKVWPL